MSLRAARSGSDRLPSAARCASRGAAGSGLALLLALSSACISVPPADPDDICAILGERRVWQRAAEQSFARWGVPVPVQLAIVYQESRFEARARPPRRRILGVLPGPRASSAYGYAQVQRDTWDDYRRSTGRRGADRHDFADAADFIGWYADLIQRTTGIAKHDARRLYLAYHEGPWGFRRGSHADKPWLLAVADRVAERARRYGTQYAACRGSSSW